MMLNDVERCENMKKKILILSIVFAFVLVICAFNYKWIYYHFYPFDRITGEYEITVNGKEVNTIEEYYEYENGGKIRLENDTENFKIKAGKYGPYKIGFVISDEKLHELTKDDRFIGYGNVDLSIICFETNWWHVSELDIEIDIQKENDEWFVCYDVEYSNALESDEELGQRVTKKVLLSEVSKADIYVGI